MRSNNLQSNHFSRLPYSRFFISLFQDAEFTLYIPNIFLTVYQRISEIFNLYLQIQMIICKFRYNLFLLYVFQIEKQLF